VLTADQNIKILSEKFTSVNIALNDQYFEIQVLPEDIFGVVKELKDNNNLSYDQLTDLSAVDYPSREKRFDIFYIFLSMTSNTRVLIKSSIKESEKLKSITSIFKSADWYERECYDLFGIQFLNHPDLRRIMTDYNFEGHPLRKDFPLTGHTEVRYDDLEKKVVYEPVKLTQEYRDFDYMSPWEGIDNNLFDEDNHKKDKK
tara:strand:+ start:552 stop:1154 length:603 start_codon:yes stop_codon:yes gene_type:complete